MTSSAPPLPPLARVRVPDHAVVTVDGANVIVAERPVLPLVQIVALRGGAVAHTVRRLAAATVLEATGARDRLAAIGASATAEPTPDGVLLRICAPAGDATRAVATAIDLLRPAPTPPAVVTAAYQRLLAEDEATAAEPAAVARRAAIDIRFGTDHRLASTPATPADADDVAAWWSEATEIVVAAAGAVGIDDIAGSAAFLSAPGVTVASPPAPWQLRERAGSAQASLRAVAALPPLGHPARAAAAIAERVLGGDQNSRLRAALRERRGWGYHPGTTVEDHAGMSLLTLEVDVASEVARPAATVVAAELRRLSTEPVDGEELEAARRGVAVEVMRRLDGLGDLADLTLRLALNAATPASLDDYVSAIQAVDAESVRAAAAAIAAGLSGVVVADPSVFPDGLDRAFPYDEPPADA